MLLSGMRNQANFSRNGQKWPSAVGSPPGSEDGRRERVNMRKLSECKEFFKDLYFNCLDENGFERNPLECTERTQFETFCNTLNFIFGHEFENIRPIWTQESLNEYYEEYYKGE